MMLQCRGIGKSFGGVRALEGVTLEFPDRGIVAVIGPNGAGKTTLIDTLTGIIRPDQGRWLLNDKDVTGYSTARMANIGVARSFQGIRLLPDQTLLDNVALAIPSQSTETLRAALLPFGRTSAASLMRARATDELDRVGLASRPNDLVRSLSYGDQKLLSVVVTAATGAQVLLLDEPVAGVHGPAVETILKFVKQLTIVGRTVIFVEHDMAVVRELAETVIVLDHGQVMGVGTPDSILSRRDLLESYLG